MEKKNIKVYIADKSKKLVNEIETSVEKTDTIMVSGVSFTLKDCLNELEHLIPHVLMLGLEFADGSGVEFCKKVRENYPRIKILMLISYEEYDKYFIIQRSIDNGASGYLLKNSLPDEITAGVETVMRGNIFRCDENDILKNAQEASLWLIPAEQKMLELISEGYSDQKIAEKLTLTVIEIDTYRKMLVTKLFIAGYSNWKVSIKLHLSIDAVRSRRMALMQKLGGENSMEIPRADKSGKKIRTIKFARHEKELLELIAAGYSNNDMAEILPLTVESIKTLRRDLLSKFAPATTMTMVMEALRMGLIKLDNIHKFSKFS